MMTMTIRTYSELIRFPTFKERFRYLQLQSIVGKETFGFDRYLNQAFYRSDEWKRIRNMVIVRDNGNDLAFNGHEIYGRIIVHHLNPVTVDDVVNRTKFLLDPEYLVCVTPETHNAIHYGDESQLIAMPPQRKPGDTCPWKR